MGTGRPLIGVTTYGPELASGDILSRFSLPTAYVDAVRRAGGIPVLLPAGEPDVDSLLERLDGLVFSGGGDIDPAFHAGGSHRDVYGVVPGRDRFEIEMARRAFARPDLPLLGICRGMQVMNVALGGDLELHLPDRRGDRVLHRSAALEPTFHSVRVEAGSALDAIYATPDFPVCSWHHQELRVLGSGLLPIAWSEDGVIEGVVHDAHPFAIGVQWHPEMQLDEHPLHLRVFEELVARARGAEGATSSGVAQMRRRR
jgi:putative glutamine amidotransferase